MRSDSLLRTILAIVLLSHITSEQSTAEGLPLCASILHTAEIASGVGSANTWGNLRNNEGSLRAETSKLLEMADKKVEKTSPPTNLCPEHCEMPPQAEIVFTSVPSKFLTSYSDKSKCESHLQKTSQEPLKYLGKSFNSMSKLNDWYGDFSQGKGRDGRDLYERCDGDCSPQYSSVITRQNGKYHLDVFVVCGHARDKNDNNYDLKVQFSWNCLEKTK